MVAPVVENLLLLHSVTIKGCLGGLDTWVNNGSWDPSRSSWQSFSATTVSTRRDPTAKMNVVSNLRYRAGGPGDVQRRILLGLAIGQPEPVEQVIEHSASN